MGKKKFYAINISTGKSIVESWDECKALVEGVSGAQYKSFKTESEAKEWLGFEGGASSASSPQRDKYHDGQIHVFVDGSFQPSVSDYAGWGVVAIQNSEVLVELKGVTRGPALSRNIDGELRASIEAMRWAYQQGHQVILYHDYEGIAKWALGLWKAKSEIAKLYIQAVQPWVHCVQFQKIAAHSGDQWNDKADELAKTALQEFKDSNA